MTSHRDDDNADDALEREVVRALRDRGELIPTSDEEVRAAEEELAALESTELPPGLREYRPRLERGGRHRGGRVLRGPWLGYAAAGLVGAAAAAALSLLYLRPERAQDLSGAGRDLVPPGPSASARQGPTPIVGRECPEDCCGGSACDRASASLKECPSGQRCIACTTPGGAEGPYRLRFGTMILTEAGKRLLEGDAGAGLELCVVVPGRAAACLPALSDGSSDTQWRLLDQVSSAQDLLSGLRVEVRREGAEPDAAALASWSHPVVAAPEVFCRGLSIQPRAGEEVVGKVSVFVEQTHFVELAREPTLPALRAREAEFTFQGIAPRVYETTQRDRRFALVLGPLDKKNAQALRWAVLESGREATVSFGLDFTGAPRP